jgi:TolB-like protein/Tfp pilus assembly protein PilF
MNGRKVSSHFEFGFFYLDPGEGVLLHRGRPLPLTQKQIETLLVLIRHSGRLVKKEDLMDQVWSDACVEPANLTQTIFVLRKVLGQYEPLTHFIETVPRQGYRFVVPVKRIEVEPERASGKSSDSAGADDAANHDDFRSLAVLPFINATASADGDYLADGLTESIINQLSKLPRLRVVARASAFKYKGQTFDSQKVGKELNVLTVLTGRLVQLGDRLIIKVDLSDVAGGWHLWGEQYQRKLSDILAVQEEIAAEISNALSIKLTARERHELTKHYTDNLEAYHLYLKGRYHWNKYSHNGLKRALDFFQQAIELDPTYALAYAGMADCYYRLSNTYMKPVQAMPRARAAALQALEIDDTLPEAHAALGLVKMLHDWDWPGAEQEFRRAIELNQNCSIAHQRLGLFFNLLGRADDAIAELRVAMKLDPLSAQIPQGLGIALLQLGQYDRAIEEMRTAVDLERNYHTTNYMLGWLHERKGELAEAVGFFEMVVATDDSPMYLAALGYAYAVYGLTDKARDVLDQLQKQSEERFVSQYSLAMVHAGLGEADRAFEYLELAYEERADMMAWLKIGPEWTGLRADPRFQSLQRRVGLHRDYQKKYKYSIAQ